MFINMRGCLGEELKKPIKGAQEGQGSWFSTLVLWWAGTHERRNGCSCLHLWEWDFLRISTLNEMTYTASRRLYVVGLSGGRSWVAVAFMAQVIPVRLGTLEGGLWLLASIRMWIR